VLPEAASGFAQCAGSSSSGCWLMPRSLTPAAVEWRASTHGGRHGRQGAAILGGDSRLGGRPGLRGSVPDGYATPARVPPVALEGQLALGAADACRSVGETEVSTRRPPSPTVPTKGTAEAPSLEHARDLAAHRLHVLRASLGNHWQTSPAQLLFELGDHALIGPTGVLVCTDPRPFDLTLHDGHTERLQDMQEVFDLLPKCHRSVSAAVERAIEWIGRGLCRRWPGDAIRDYTTALEVLLMAGEAQKSVLVPYRMLLLADLHGRSMIHPTAIRHAFDRRHIVVHEGEASAGDPVSTRRMLAAAQECLGRLTRFAASQPDESQAAILHAIDTPSGRARAVDWLESLPDAWSRKLTAGIRSLPK